jgi:hypothetical protein
MPPWVDDWLNNHVMPPHTFPGHLLERMRSRAEDWMLSDNRPRRQAEEFVSREESYAVMDGLLFSGFCRDRRQPGRIPPVELLGRCGRSRSSLRCPCPIPRPTQATSSCAKATCR